MISRLEVITQVAATSLLELARGVSVVEFASKRWPWSGSMRVTSLSESLSRIAVVQKETDSKGVAQTLLLAVCGFASRNTELPRTRQKMAGPRYTTAFFGLVPIVLTTLPAGFSKESNRDITAAIARHDGAARHLGAAG
jgi:hypothetical protein